MAPSQFGWSDYRPSVKSPDGRNGLWPTTGGRAQTADAQRSLDGMSRPPEQIRQMMSVIIRLRIPLDGRTLANQIDSYFGVRLRRAQLRSGLVQFGTSVEFSSVRSDCVRSVRP